MELKINQLLKRWQKGTVATALWLREQGVSRQLTRRYVMSNWIESAGHGAFLRCGDKVDWLGGVHALQTQLGLNVYPGGYTALSLRNLGHFLTLGSDAEVSLLAEQKERLPPWFTRYAWGVRIHYRNVKLFNLSSLAGFMDVKHGDFSIRASAPERAILEVLYSATTNDEIDHAVELMSGLTTLRPQLLQSLLEECRSVRVKRIFLWAAEVSGHEWFKRLALQRVELGKGKRQLYRGGHYSAKYRITVPKREDAHV